jgi:hypothetical protein
VTRELALFPLKTVLFADGPLALRVFEPRYLDMVARALRGDNRFGVVAIRSGSEVGEAETYDVGTAAEIVDWDQEAPGVLGIRAVGRETFRVERRSRAPDGLYVGSVEMLDDVPSAPLPAQHAPLADLLRKLLAQVPIYAGVRVAYGDAAWIGARFAEILPLPLATKQSLLEMRDAAARLDRIAASLRSGSASA